MKIITFDAGPSSVFSGSELRRPEPSITFGKYKVTSTLQGTRISRSGCVLSSDCKVYGQFIRQNVWSNDEETEAVRASGSREPKPSGLLTSPLRSLRQYSAIIWFPLRGGALNPVAKAE